MFTETEKYLLYQNAVTGEPAIEKLARWWNVDELGLYDEVQKIKEDIVNTISEKKTRAEVLGIIIPKKAAQIVQYNHQRKPEPQFVSEVFDMPIRERAKGQGRKKPFTF